MPAHRFEDFLSLGSPRSASTARSSIQVVRRLRAALLELESSVLPEYAPGRRGRARAAARHGRGGVRRDARRRARAAGRPAGDRRPAAARRPGRSLPTTDRRRSLRAWLQPSHSSRHSSSRLPPRCSRRAPSTSRRSRSPTRSRSCGSLGQTTWLLGTLALFTGYLFQAGALDRGRLSVIQPLLVTTVVFALPLGYFLTQAARRPSRGDRRHRDPHRARAVRLLRRPGGRQRERVQRAVGDRDRPARRGLRRCSSCSAGAATSR